MTKQEALQIIVERLAHDMFLSAEEREAIALSSEALKLSIRLGEDTDKKCAYCGDDMYVLVRGHHHTETFNGVQKDVTQNANGL